MGLIHFIRDFVEWRRMRRRFSSYIDLKLVRKVIEDPDSLFEPPRQMELEFILMALDDDDSAGVPSMLTQSLAMTRTHRGWPESLTGPLVLVLFGYPAQDPEAVAHRTAMVPSLSEALGNRTKILHGRRTALVGFVAGKEGPYGAILHGYHRLLRELSEMEFGQVRETVL